MKLPPPGPVLGTQHWTDLLFLHWAVPVEAVQATLPPGVFTDTHEGVAYVGIVPFAMQRVRPAFLPPVPWLSWFLELNVRTYVRDAEGTPAVWFHSLDCNQPIAVEIARRFFHLNYLHARMHATRQHGTVTYRCTRRGQGDVPWEYGWTTGGPSAPAVAGTLEHFLVERYVLLTTDARGRLYRGRVSHAPYRLHVPELRTHSTGPAAAAGFDLQGPPVSVLAAEPVTVNIHPLRRR